MRPDTLERLRNVAARNPTVHHAAHAYRCDDDPEWALMGIIEALARENERLTETLIKVARAAPMPTIRVALDAAGIERLVPPKGGVR